MTLHPSDPEAPRGDLITDLLTGLSRLVRGEIDLAKAEAARTLRAAMRGAILAATALMAGLATIGLLAAALAAAFMQWGLSPAMALLASAAVFAVVGAIAVAAAAHFLKRVGNFPDRTSKNLSRDMRTLKEGVTSDAT